MTGSMESGLRPKSRGWQLKPLQALVSPRGGGHTVSILTSPRGGPIHAAGGPVHGVGFASPRSPSPSISAHSLAQLNARLDSIEGLIAQLVSDLRVTTRG